MVLMLIESQRDRTQVKVLGSPSVMCEQRDCGESAAYLFRTGDGPIIGYCEVHARQHTSRLGLTLPELPSKVLRATW